MVLSGAALADALRTPTGLCDDDRVFNDLL